MKKRRRSRKSGSLNASKNEPSFVSVALVVFSGDLTFLAGEEIGLGRRKLAYTCTCWHSNMYWWNRSVIRYYVP
jgi:hypothetical protein